MSFEKFAKIEKSEDEGNGMIKIFIFGGILAALMVFIGINAETALKREEIRECLAWQKLSKELRSDLFFLTSAQKKQCDTHGIKISASVKGGG